MGGAMSNDKQRVPHCELFKGQKDKKRKNCHVCKGSDHLRKECPRKLAKKQYKTPRASKLNDWSTPQLSGNANGSKMKFNLERIINRTKETRTRKERELKMLNEKENDLMRLLNEYDLDEIDDKVLRIKLKAIAQSFNGQRKCLRKENKKMRKKQKRERKKEKKMIRRERKKAKRQNKKKKGQNKERELKMLNEKENDLM